MTEEKVFVLWFKNGTTAMFENVSEIKYSSGMISFNYNGKSTGKRMHANFYRDSISGHAELVD